MTRLDLPEPSPSRWKRVWVPLLRLGLAVLAAYLCFRLLRSTRWSSLGGRIAAARRLPLAAAFAALLLRFTFWDARFRHAARRALGISAGPLRGFLILFASAAANLITPSAGLAGSLLRTRYQARAIHRSFATVYGVMLFDQLAHHAVMLAATWVAVAATALALQRTGLGLAVLGALVGLTGLAGLGAAAAPALLGRRPGGGGNPSAVAPTLTGRQPGGDMLAATAPALTGRRPGDGTPSAAEGEGPLARRLARIVPAIAGSWRQPLVAQGQEATATCSRLLADRSLRAPCIALGMGYFLANAAAQWLVFAALGEPVGTLSVITVVAVGNAAGVFTGTPGGAGTTEATMVPLYVMLGVGAETAAAGTLLFRGLHYAGVLGLGVPALAGLEMRSGRRR